MVDENYNDVGRVNFGVSKQSLVGRDVGIALSCKRPARAVHRLIESGGIPSGGGL